MRVLAVFALYGAVPAAFWASIVWWLSANPKYTLVTVVVSVVMGLFGYSIFAVNAPVRPKIYQERTDVD